MKYVKQFENYNEKTNEDTQISIDDAFNTYIKGQNAVGIYSAGSYGEGVVFENGYKYTSYGGGCSGEDCNTSYILNPNDDAIAESNW